MTAFEAAVYGVVQGLTEFIPVSSTAHLRIASAALSPNDDIGAAFTAVIQWGTWVACVFYFRKDIGRLFAAFVLGIWENRPLGTQDAKLAWMLLVGTVPIGVLGLLLHKVIENELRALTVIAAAAIVLAVLMAFAETLHWMRARAGTPGREEAAGAFREGSGYRTAEGDMDAPGPTRPVPRTWPPDRRRPWGYKDLSDLGWGETLLVGFAQCVALIPGASRSGTTITGGIFAGMTRDAAARFSFLLSLPSVFAAGLYELYKERDQLLHSQQDILNLVIATVVAGIVGYASIALLIRYLRSHTTWVFIGYRLLLGVLLFVLVGKGFLPNQPPPDAPPVPAKTARLAAPAGRGECDRDPIGERDDLSPHRSFFARMSSPAPSPLLQPRGNHGDHGDG